MKQVKKISREMLITFFKEHPDSGMKEVGKHFDCALPTARAAVMALYAEKPAVLLRKERLSDFGGRAAHCFRLVDWKPADQDIAKRFLGGVSKTAEVEKAPIVTIKKRRVIEQDAAEPVCSENEHAATSVEAPMPSHEGQPKGIVPVASEEAVEALEAVFGDACRAFASRAAHMLADAIAEQLATRILTEVAHRLNSIQLPEITGLASKAVKEMPQRTHKRLKVCVIGVPQNNAPSLRQEFGKEFHLELLSADDTARIRGSVAHADHVIVLIDHVGHKVNVTLAAAGAKPIFLPGNMSALRDKLTELYVAA